MDDAAVDIGEAEVAALEAVSELFVVDAELVEQGGVEIVYVNFVDLGVVAEFIGFAVGNAGFDAAAGHPD